MNKKYIWLLIGAFFVLLAAIFQLSSPNIPDSDSFFYIRQSWLYRTEGLFNASFPWTYYSAIKTLSSSLWYGFSILLIPLTYISNLVTAIKIAGILFTALVLFAFYWVLKRHQLKMPLFWSTMLFFSSSNVLVQFLMVRPQIISLALTPLLFSFLISGGFLPVFLVSFGIAWLHLNFVWILILILGVVVFVKLLLNSAFEWKKAAAVLAGGLLGWLLRPEPLNAAKLFYIQVFQQILEKQGGLPLLFGNENFPLSVNTLFRNFTPFLILLVAAVIILIWFLRKKLVVISAQQKTILWSSGLLSVISFFLTMFIARRTYNLWAEFGIIFIAAVFTHFISSNRTGSLKTFRDISIMAVSVIFIFMVFYSGYKGITFVQKSGYSPDELKEVSLWLKENSQPGDIVFNLHWPDFSPLFFWNQKNYYIGGLDPIFQYSYNPGLYWKFHYLSADQVTKKTCGAVACTVEMLEDTYNVLIREFNAKYIVLTKQENPAVNYFLENDPRFQKVFSTNKEAVYLIER